MRARLSLTLLALAAWTATALPATAAPAEITVFAAASLTDALKEVATAYESSTGDKVVFNFAASSALARQIQEGAPADLFFSADEAKMDDLEKRGLLAKGTRRSLLSNTLVVVVPADSSLTIASPADLATPKVKALALAEPQTVPAGIYAKDWLKSQKLWSRVIDKVIPTENVRAALGAVESGNVSAGIVYKTDAGISKKVKIAYEVPAAGAAGGPKISYPLAVIAESKRQEAARRLLAYLESPAALDVFRRYGFLVPQGSP
ncbi:MAG TPA: molybdate ABC transporter substrate-binding protein [Thermoanaerobaculia bacterium]|jgi:molybdate transport system substrate-binding protein|nr:molybdate ABC transporter substrate-binding protein [Thermoanaerobaculia bacterium]